MVRITSIMDNKVNKSGDTITGDLIIKRNSTAQFSLRNLSMDSAVNPKAWGAFGIVNFFDKNNVRTGLIENQQFEDGRMQILMRALNRGKYAQILVGVRADGTFYTECPASKTNKSIETIVSSGSNYLRFGSRLQICWGVGGAGTVTLPVPFANTNYQVTTSQVGGGHTYNCGTDTYTTTKFNIQNHQAHWVAIGYWY